MEQLDERKKRAGLGSDVRDLEGRCRLGIERGEEVGLETVHRHALVEEVD
jgi:hypothetical protein